ncbi:hypothetical protein MferCBS31731_005610 [Microsporum ferrugineum]
MRAAFTLLLAAVAATTAAADDDITTILPNERPTVTIDPWECLTQNLTEYFDVPRPTGAFFSAVHSHGSELIKDCVAATKPVECPFPESSDWCSLSTSIPASVLPAYSAYGSVASVWWKSHSSAAFSAAAECPLGWFDAMLSIPGGRTWMNLTRIYGGCYANTQPTSGSEPSKLLSMTTGPTAMPGAGAAATDPIQPTATPMKNSILGWAQSRPGSLVVAGAGLAAVSINSML